MSAIKFPSKAAFEKARAAKPDDSDTMPGRVHGVDLAEWATAIVDLSRADKQPQRVASTRARLKAKGYLPLEGSPEVDGFDHCEVWIKPRGDWEADRRARRDRIRQHMRDGQMSDTALMQQTYSGPNGTFSA